MMAVKVAVSITNCRHGRSGLLFQHALRARRVDEHFQCIEQLALPSPPVVDGDSDGGSEGVADGRSAPDALWFALAPSLVVQRPPRDFNYHSGATKDRRANFAMSATPFLAECHKREQRSRGDIGGGVGMPSTTAGAPRTLLW